MHNKIPPWLLLAQAELGVREIPGVEHNPRVLWYFKKAGWPSIQDDETAWCAAFVSAILELAGIPSAKTVRARDYLNWGVPILEPVPGCITVFRRGTGTQGHVAFFVKWSADGTKVLVLGGNQSNQVCEQWYSAFDLLGFRMPHGYAAPVPADDDLPRVARPTSTSTPPPIPGPVQLAEEDQEAGTFPVRNYPTHDETVDQLRERGSRIIYRAERTKSRGRFLQLAGIGTFITGVLQFFSDAYATLLPLAPAIGATALGLIVMVIAVGMAFDQKEIVAARVEDHQTGLHCGAGGCKIE